MALKTVGTLAVALSLTSNAHAVVFIGERTNPSLSELQAGYDSGKKYQHYPGIVRTTEGGGLILPATNNYLFAKDLKPGSVMPTIVDPRALLRAAKKDQVVLVASTDEGPSLCFPVFKELAEQNNSSCSELMGHVAEQAKDDSTLGTALGGVMEVQAQVTKMTEEIIEKMEQETEEAVQEMVEEVVEDMMPVIEKEMKDITPPMASAPWNGHLDDWLDLVDRGMVTQKEVEAIADKLGATTESVWNDYDAEGIGTELEEKDS